jgi:hypothetical protein
MNIKRHTAACTLPPARLPVQVGRAFVSWAVTLYVLYVAWVYVGDEWHARGRPKPNIQGLQQRLLAFTESFGWASAGLRGQHPLQIWLHG